MEAIGRNSNLGHLRKKFADPRKRINESPSRPFLSRQDGRKPRSKRFLTAAQDIADIVRRYGVGETTQQIGNRYGISKTRVAKALCEQGVAMRRQGLNDEQATEAAKLYAAGRSLAWLGVRYDVSPTTIATALRREAYTYDRGQDGRSEPRTNRRPGGSGR